MLTHSCPSRLNQRHRLAKPPKESQGHQGVRRGPSSCQETRIS